MKRFLFFMTMSLFPFAALCQQEEGMDTDFEAFKERIAEAGEQNKTIACRFVQIKKVKGIRELDRKEGCFFYDKAGRVALLYAHPQGDRIVMDGDRFLMVNAGKKMETNTSSNPMLGYLAGLLKACMSGDLLELGNNWSFRLEETQGFYRVELRPESRKKKMSSLIVVFDKSDMTLNELRMDEGDGFWTQYVFDSKQLNVELDSAVFE